MTFVGSWATHGAANAKHANTLMHRNTESPLVLGRLNPGKPTFPRWFPEPLNFVTL